MFCKNCGCKLPVGANKCPGCNTDKPIIEYCGGFWGLVDEEKTELIKESTDFANEEEVKHESKLSPMSEVDIRHEELQRRNVIKWKLLFLVSGLVILTLIIITLTGRATNKALQEQLEKNEREYAQKEEKNQEQIEALISELDEKQQQNKKYEERINDLEQQISDSYLLDKPESEGEQTIIPKEDALEDKSNPTELIRPQDLYSTFNKWRARRK